MSQKAVGRAFRITDKDARSYDRTTKPRSKMRPNPMGVTTLAMVNGRGAYASAKAGAQGQTRAQRLARARKLIGGKGMQSNARGHRAAFISAMRSNKGSAKSKGSGAKSTDLRRRGKRLAAYKSALKRNGTKAGAARAALRAVPFTANERKRKTSFAGVKARKKYRRNDFVGVGKSAWGEAGASKPAAKAKNKQPRTQRRPTRAQYQAPPPEKKKTSRKGKQVAKAKRKTKAKKRRAAGSQYRTVKQTVKRKTRVAFGKYKRARLYNPRTGKTEYSYMYRSGGKLRRIPTAAVSGWGERGKKSGERATKMAARMQAARKRAADRILKEGDVFIPNKKRKTKKKRKGSSKRKSAKRVAAGKKAARTRKRRAKASGAKRRKSKGGAKRKRKSAKASGAKRRKSKGGAKRKRKSAKRVAAGKKAARTRKRKGGGKKRKASAKRGGKRGGKRRSGAKRLRKGTYYVANRRRRRSKGRRMRKNAFMANLKNVLITGTLVAVGYMGHRVLTSLACEYIFTPYVTAPEGKEPNLALKTWEKPICGAVVGLVGVGALSVMADKRIMSGETAMKIGGGMVASLVQYVVVSALAQFDQPKAASYLSGYSNSAAYGLRGNRRGMSGMSSIMPHYQQLGAFQQAAAGMGEYFTGTGAFEQAAAGVGEYFVPGGTKGVGQYEAAGPLAMQAAANGIGEIEDGIRPDSNLDHVLDLAESAAGLGEYYTATPGAGGYAEGTVPQQSQWIPNGPLWAGTMAAKDTMATSELPAGVLATVGGNGVLSG